MAFGGIADKTQAQRYKRRIIRMLLGLQKKGKINPDYKEAMLAIKVLAKSLDHSASTVNELDKLIDKYGEDQAFLTDIQKYGIRNFNLFLNSYGYLMLFQILRYYSIIENTLIVMLLGATYGKKGTATVDGSKTLGQMIDIIAGFYPSDELRKAIDPEFRWTLAHGWYYFDNNNLVCFKDGSLKMARRMDLAELFLRHRLLGLFCQELMQVIEHADWNKMT